MRSVTWKRDERCLRGLPTTGIVSLGVCWRRRLIVPERGGVASGAGLSPTSALTTTMGGAGAVRSCV